MAIDWTKPLSLFSDIFFNDKASVFFFTLNLYFPLKNRFNDHMFCSFAKETH